MRAHLTTLVVFTLLLAGCNLPQPGAATPTPDFVATEVSFLLTQAPTPAPPTPAVHTTAPSPTIEIATATQAPSPTALMLATSTQPPAPALDPNDPKAALGSPTWQNTLSSGRAFYQYENDNTRVTQADDALVLTGVTANGWHGWSLTHSQQPLNFYLEGLFQPQSCSGNDLYGLMFRATDSAGYFFGVTCDGRYSLHARNFEDGSEEVITRLTAHPAILSGSQANRLGVMVRGDRLTLYANGALLGEATNATYDEKGYFGAFVAAYQTPNFTIKMDEINLWNLP